MRRSSVLSIRDLSIRLAGRPILACDEFDLRQGDKVLLTSRSGGGKSVFLRCLAGLLPLGAVERGEFTRGASHAQPLSYGEYARQRRGFGAMSFVFQDAFNSLHPFRPVSRQLREGRPSDDDKGLISDLATFRLADLELLEVDRFRDRLSGGQCQRISLLLSADRNQQIILLDEPLTDIDAFARASIEDLLLKRLFGPDNSQTVVLVTHNAQWLKRLDPELIRHFTIEANVEDDAAACPQPQIAPRLMELPDDRKLVLDLKVLAPAARRAARAAQIEVVRKPGATDIIPDAPVLSLRVDRRISPGGKKREGFQLWPQPRATSHTGITVDRGEGIALYGLSGSGKSLLLRCMAGLGTRSAMRNVTRCGQHDLAQGGSPVDLRALSPARLASNIQYIFQNNRGSVSLSSTLDEDLQHLKEFSIANLMRLMKAYADNGGPMLSKQQMDGQIEGMITELWERLCIPAAPLRDRTRFKLSDLSLGMLRRYSLIRALVKLDVHTAWQSARCANLFDTAPWQVRFKPRVLLADEISRGLDAESLFQLGQLIRDLKHTAKLSVVIVSHENQFTAALAERIYLVVDGFVMPTMLEPAVHGAASLSERHAFEVPTGLSNPIYELYCPPPEASLQPALTSPDLLEKLTAKAEPGCIVHRSLGGPGAMPGGTTGCPNHGGEYCKDEQLKAANTHGVCC